MGALVVIVVRLLIKHYSESAQEKLRSDLRRVETSHGGSVRVESEAVLKRRLDQEAAEEEAICEIQDRIASMISKCEVYGHYVPQHWFRQGTDATSFEGQRRQEHRDHSKFIRERALFVSAELTEKLRTFVWAYAETMEPMRASLEAVGANQNESATEHHDEYCRLLVEKLVPIANEIESQLRVRRDALAAREARA